MDQQPQRPRRIALDRPHGPFPRAKGGQCDFRPALTMGAMTAGDPAAVRIVYPCPDETAESWVRVRW
ncbi:hypothetical protein [Sphingomonas fuzhouensis]|uniref:hypothetical protein n=1 Tax=Sphingomonas fuzhouensis TaxID=3106033 RepID=UPI002AFFFAC1|nr:hypothetical protein [Sphingomonas sp. SGZ-02]